MAEISTPIRYLVERARRAAWDWERAALDGRPTSDARRRLAEALWDLDDFDLADAFNEVLAVRLRSQAPVEAGRVLLDGGRRAAQRGNYRGALEFFTQARTLLIDDAFDTAALEHDTAEILVDLGDLDGAVMHLENARAYWTVAGFRSGRGDAGMMLADCYAATGRLRDASQAYAAAADDYVAAGLGAMAAQCHVLEASIANVD